MVVQSQENTERQYRILAFGVEKVGLSIPETITDRNFSIDFEAYGTGCRFDDYDAVFVFQGIFERFTRKTGFHESYLVHNYDTNELDKRKKELAQLLRKGGFACFLLVSPFIDRADRVDTSNTDLTKYYLNHDSLYRKSFAGGGRATGIRAVVSEFASFVDRFGAAYTYFHYYGESLFVHKLAVSGNVVVGARFGRNIYAIPSLMPDNTEEVLREYFTSLANALVALENKKLHEVPDWVRDFEFTEESGLARDRADLETQLQNLANQQDQLESYKLALVASSDDLVAIVSQILETGLGIPVNVIDEFREDIKLLDNKGEAIAVAEIKGTNRGIKREHVNQADSHRERSEFDPSFPALLIMNTHIRGARTVAEKNKDVPAEQVSHAANNKILILRTLDLLNLLRRVRSGKTTRDAALRLILENVGWLQVGEDGVTVHPSTTGDSNCR